MINCIYHPVYPMRVVDDEEYAKLLASGEWFKHPNEAKELRAICEKRNDNHETRPIRRNTRKRIVPLKQDEQDAGITT